MKSAWLAWACAMALAAPVAAEDSTWVQLFNGKDLTDWQVRFSGKPVGQDASNVFRVENGMLTVKIESNIGFGHIYYMKRQFSHYLVRTQYKFLADKSASGYPAWTNQNNGIMFHSPAAKLGRTPRRPGTRSSPT
jgi:hypothetical protein